MQRQFLSEHYVNTVVAPANYTLKLSRPGFGPAAEPPRLLTSVPQGFGTRALAAQLRQDGVTRSVVYFP